ncbi:hypothetical protein ACFL0V_01285 [Nanoarchaeota archaeon]
MLRRIASLIQKVEEYVDFESLSDVDRVPDYVAIRRIRKLTSDGWGGQLALLLGDPGIVFMMPHNNGMPACPFVWYRKNGEYTEIIHNQHDFTQVQDLPGILEGTADVMTESYGRKKPVDSFSNFGIRLTDEVQPDYAGRGKLVLIIGPFLSAKAKAEPEAASIYFANEYLDKFVGWNFGDVVRVNQPLEEKLLGLNERLIADGVRPKRHPTGFEVGSRGEIDCFYDFQRE